MEKLYIISETSKSLGDTAITNLTGEWYNETDTVYLSRMEHCAQKCVEPECKYQFISESQFPPDFDNYNWDYTNYDGIGSVTEYTLSWDEYKLQNGIV